MAIAPLQIPQLGAVSAADWSGLEKLGEAIKQGRIDQMRRDAIQQYGAGNPRALLEGGDLQLANLYAVDQARTQATQRDARDFQFRQDEAKRTQSNADRGFGIQERTATRLEDPTPANFRKTATGVQPIPGSEADPAYIEKVARIKSETKAPRQMSATDIGKITDEGGKISDLTGMLGTFKPEFGGNLITGGLRNVAGAYLPEGVAGKTNADSAQWWANFNRAENAFRHEIFGSALTPSEKAAWERTSIDPRMDPKAIQANLTLRKQILERAANRRGEAMVNEGYNPETISRAYGLKFAGKPGTPAAATPAPGAVGSGGAVDWQSYFGGQR